jgi:tetratricopeptide (TPR) repeat protein
LSVCGAAAQDRDLPRLALETFPPSTRALVAQAYARAEQAPRDAAAVGELGMLLHAYDQYASAEVCYRRAHELDPRSFQWAYGLAVVQASRGQHVDAVASFRQALRLDPEYLPAQVRLAESLFAAGDPEASRALYEHLLKDHRDLAVVHYGLGRLKAAAGQLPAAVEEYSTACRLFNEFGAAHYALALAYRDLGEPLKAQQHLSAYEKNKLRWPPLEDPTLDRVTRLKDNALQHLARGVALGRDQQIGDAIREHERALALDPTLVQAHANLISLYGQLGEWNKAEEHYRAAVGINPGLAEVHYDYGVLLAQQGKWRDAAAAFTRALEINPFFARAHNNLGEMLERDGRVADAAEHYRRALENDPQFRTARFNLGRMLVALNKNAEAIEEFLKILLPEDENTPRYTFALAAAYVRAGDLTNGVRYAEQAKQRAEALGQRELAASIERDLQQLRAARK